MNWKEALQEIYLREIHYRFSGIKLTKERFLKQLEMVSGNQNWDNQFIEQSYTSYLASEGGIELRY